MNFLDILFGIPLLWFAYKGFNKGLIVEIASLAALIAGIYLSVHFSWFVGGYIENLFDMKDQYISLVAFTLTFLGVVVVVHLVGKMTTQMAEHLALGLPNRLAGALFAFLKVAFIISIVLYLYARIDTDMKVIPEKLREESMMYKPVSQFAPAVIPKLEAEHQKIRKHFSAEEE